MGKTFKTLKFPAGGLLLSVIASVMPVCALADAGELQLWPAGEAQIRAQPSSSIEPLPGGALQIRTGTQYKWPGARVEFAAGEKDFSEFGFVSVAVSNMTAKPLKVHASVKGRKDDATINGPGGNIELGAREAGEISIRLGEMAWTLDKPLDLPGMNGRPKARDAGDGFSPARVRSIHIFLSRPDEEARFAICGVTAFRIARKVISADAFFPFVDKYGQFMHDDWPEKIHNDEELVALGRREDALLAKSAKSPAAGLDGFGGWKDGPQLAATGFFRTEKFEGKWWLVDPEGRLFWSHGVNAVCQGEATGIGGREKFFAFLPPKDDAVFGRFRSKSWKAAAHGFYSDAANVPFETFDFARANARRKYGEDFAERFAGRTLARMKAWGLNTIASWSDRELQRARRVPYTILLKTSRAPRLEGTKGWWGSLPDPYSPEFEETLRERAREVAPQVRDDPWCLGVFVDNELSWNDDARMAEIAERYFSTVRRVLKEELPNHLYLGCRIAWGGDAVWRAAAKYCDVVSCNIYKRMPRRDWPEGAGDKPVLVSEFHFGATDRGMFHPGLAAAPDQRRRAKMYRDFALACLDDPRIVGAHWFQWRDQPLAGRPDGENYAIGLVSVADVPHVELVKAVRKTAHEMYRRRNQSNSHTGGNNR